MPCVHLTRNRRPPQSPRPRAGAPIDARKLTSEVAALATEGGPVRVQHLIAKTAVLDSSRHRPDSPGQAGGPVSITTAYAASLRVSSGPPPAHLHGPAQPHTGLPSQRLHQGACSLSLASHVHRWANNASQQHLLRSNMPAGRLRCTSWAALHTDCAPGRLLVQSP